MNAPQTLRLPPHSIESEQSLLGGLLLDNGAWDRIADQVAEADFYRDDHRRIFRHIRALIEAGKPADVVTVFESLEKNREADQAGGLAYLGEIANNTPSAANIRRYAEIVRERATLRRVQLIGDTLAVAAGNPAGRTAEQIVAEAEASMAQALDQHAGDPVPLVEVFTEVSAYVDERRERGRELAGLTSGFDSFDRLTGGLEPGHLVIVAARPSVGKTIFACNFADHVASGSGSVLFMTLEMTRREIGMRVLSARSKVSVHAMRAGTNEPEDWRRMTDQLARADGQRLAIDDKPAASVSYVRAKARRIQRQRGLDLIVIDYLQLMSAQTERGATRTQEIGSISRGLKSLAKELHVPVVALAQLNRGVEGRQDKRPVLSDLRDSGEVEQDADIVVMLHRESLYSDEPEWQGVAELIIRKNRNGPLGDIMLQYLPEQMRFANHDGPNIRRQLATQQQQRPARGGFDD